MLTHKKYDVVISFSEEQRDIAVSISIALENLGISTYYYPYNAEENIGKDLELNLTEIYNSSAVVAIAILSKKYFSSRFTMVELNSIRDRLQKEKDYLIPIKYDDCIPKDLEYLTYYEWKSDPIGISNIVKTRLEKKICLYLEDAPLKISKLPKKALLQGVARFSKYRNIKNPDFYFRLSLYHYFLNQSKEDVLKAKELLQVVISHNPIFHQAYYWLSRIAIEEKGIHSITHRDIQQPVDWLQRAIRLAPSESLYIEFAHILTSTFYRKHGLTSPF